MSNKLIDVEKVFEDKNPRLLRLMPGFIINYIKKILHQDEINQFIATNSSASAYEFSLNGLKHLNISVDVEGEENIPQQGGIVFVGNHPFGGLEALAQITAIQPIRPDVKFVVNDILLNIEPLKELFVGINKHGSTPKETALYMNKLFGSGDALFIYPAGLVSRRINGQILDLEWKKTFVSRSKQHDIQIVPVFTGGAQLSNFFYNLANFRKKIGIKANLEMFYLADEMMKQRNSTFKIVFGEPFSSKTFDKSKNDWEWTAWVRNKVYNLAKNN